MSKELDETTEVLQETYDAIVGYGRQATFTVKGTPDVDHEWWISPPRAAESLRANENTQTEVLEFLIPALDIPFTPKRLMQVVDSKDDDKYQITNVDPLDSGLLTAAYRIRAAR
jgi:hypothetical protein